MLKFHDGGEISHDNGMSSMHTHTQKGNSNFKDEIGSSYLPLHIITTCNLQVYC